MNPYITRALAQQIVDTVKDLCGQNVNFIDCSGVIFASTDSGRIGSFHEIGRQAAVSGKLIEVEEDDRFRGTQKGVNLPVYHNHDLIAVVGITGEPETVRRYARLAERITRLLIREKELDAFNRTEAEKKSYVLRALIDGEAIHPEYLSENLKKWAIDEAGTYRLIRMKISSPVPEPRIHRLFLTLGVTLYTFRYPEEYLAVLEERQFSRGKRLLEEFAGEYPGQVQIGAGSPASIHRIGESAAQAASALKSLEHSGGDYAEFDNLTLELILSCLDARSRDAYLARTVASLSEKDRDLLRTYFQCGMSLKETCEKTFLHKNTLQYRLNQIHLRCGRNPRSFPDAVELYLALLL